MSGFTTPVESILLTASTTGFLTGAEVTPRPDGRCYTKVGVGVM
jgi:hypothetical protein